MTQDHIVIDGAIVGKVGEQVPLLRDGVEDARDFIAQWNRPETYDRLAQEWRWRAPNILVSEMLPYLKPEHPILDVGAGSGLTGEILVNLGYTVDGIDIGKKSLEVAEQRGYRRTICANIVQKGIADVVGEKYHVMISAGVFGDFIKARWLPKVLEMLEDEAVVGICGRSVLLNDALPYYLKEAGFDLVLDRREFAYRQAGQWLEYDYVVGVRNTGSQ